MRGDPQTERYRILHDCLETSARLTESIFLPSYGYLRFDPSEKVCHGMDDLLSRLTEAGVEIASELQ